MIENADLPLITEKNEIQERMPPKLKADPIDSTEPTEPMESTEPADPIERIDPVEPIDSSEPDEGRARRDMTLSSPRRSAAGWWVVARWRA
jgi:hypothetical protein